MLFQNDQFLSLAEFVVSIRTDERTENYDTKFQ